MDSFGSSATHIVACECSGETVMLSAARLQATLNTIDARAFPMHVPTSTGGPTDLPPNQVAGRNLLKFHLRPASRIGIDATEVPKALQFSDIAEAVKSDPEVWQVLEQASKACAAHQLEHAPPASIAVRALTIFAGLPSTWASGALLPCPVLTCHRLTSVTARMSHGRTSQGMSVRSLCSAPVLPCPASTATSRASTSTCFSVEE